MYFPSGTHRITKTIDVPDGTTVCGDGPGTMLVSSVNPVFRVRGAIDVVFRDFSLEVEYSGKNYTTGIHFQNSSNGTQCEDCVVENVRFALSERPEPGHTHMGILANHCSGLRVTGCLSHHMQFVLASGQDRTPVTDVSVTGCRFIDPFNFACSFVGDEPTDTLSGFLFQGNIIEGIASSGGVFIGSDGETKHVGHLSHIHVKDNIFRGEWGPKAFSAVQVTLASTSRDIQITGNSIANEGVKVNNSYGIGVIAPRAGATLAGCHISGNSAMNMDLEGVRAHVAVGRISGLWVCDNDLRGTRGLMVYGEQWDVFEHGNLTKNGVE